MTIITNHATSPLGTGDVSHINPTNTVVKSWNGAGIQLERENESGEAYAAVSCSGPFPPGAWRAAINVVTYNDGGAVSVPYLLRIIMTMDGQYLDRRDDNTIHSGVSTFAFDVPDGIDGMGVRIGAPNEARGDGGHAMVVNRLLVMPQNDHDVMTGLGLDWFDGATMPLSGGGAD